MKIKEIKMKEHFILKFMSPNVKHSCRKERSYVGEPCQQVYLA